jgi:uncharacterized protein
MAIHRFAIDKMLGRLAIWLRLIGQDATYGSHLSGRTLVRHARSQGRTVLTRDRRLLRERDVPILLVQSDHFREQLRQVVTVFELDPFAAVMTRCTRCNEPVVAVSKPTVAERVPPYVFATQDAFVRCPRCQRVYWPATHHERVRIELQRLDLPAAPTR